MNINYARRMDEIIEGLREQAVLPRLLLHVCCAPCSSHCLEQLRQDFEVTVFYFNPNITDPLEYEHRYAEELRLIDSYNAQVSSGDYTGMAYDGGAHMISVMEAPYDPRMFMNIARGLEEVPEGGERCARCFTQRLAVTAHAAATHGFDYFTTTLTISPQKDAALLNEIGQEQGRRCGVEFLPSDFKKRDGYKRSVELSGRYGLYRQDYCGCVFSKRDRERDRDKKK